MAAAGIVLEFGLSIVGVLLLRLRRKLVQQSATGIITLNIFEVRHSTNKLIRLC